MQRGASLPPPLAFPQAPPHCQGTLTWAFPSPTLPPALPASAHVAEGRGPRGENIFVSCCNIVGAMGGHGDTGGAGTFTKSPASEIAPRSPGGDTPGSSWGEELGAGCGAAPGHGLPGRDRDSGNISACPLCIPLPASSQGKNQGIQVGSSPSAFHPRAL